MTTLYASVFHVTQDARTILSCYALPKIKLLHMKNEQLMVLFRFLFQICWSSKVISNMGM